MIINDKDLKEKLKYLSFGISKNNTDPSRYKAIRFETVNGVVYGYTNNGINNIKVEISSNVKKDFSAIIDYAQFSSFIKSCEGDITLETSGKFMSIKTDIVKVKLPVYPNNTKDGGVPDPTKNVNCTKTLSTTFRTDLIKLILDTSHVVEAYRKVYFGKVMMISDTDNVLIYDEQIFDKDILLNYSSIELLNNLTNITYEYIKDGSVPKLYIKSDEIEATIIIDLNDSNDYQYDDFMELFDIISTDEIEIDTKIISKAVSTSQLFKMTPILTFNKDGIFLIIESVDFSYKICDGNFKEIKFELSTELARKICSIGNTIKLYYNYSDSLIRCDYDNIKEILSVIEVKSNE